MNLLISIEKDLKETLAIFAKRVARFIEDKKDDFHYYWHYNVIYRIQALYNATFMRYKMGFNPDDVWDLDHNLSKLILPRLKYLRLKIDSNPPEFLTLRQWQRELDKMICAFEYMSNYSSWHYKSHRDKNLKKVREGLESFARYYHRLYL